MKNGKLLVLTALLSIGALDRAQASEQELSETESAIQKKNARWHARKNEVSELSLEERKKRLGVNKGLDESPKVEFSTTGATLTSTSTSGSVSAAPPTLDWRNYNGGTFVTPVKNQGSCGSCWAFSTTAGLESQAMMSGLASPNFSEQIMVSCSGAGSCNGGYPSSASNYLVSTGLPAESYYPYTATNGTCSSALTGWQNVATRISSWISVSKSVSAMESALATYGPLPTTMAVYNDFYYYSGGVYSYASGSLQGYHAILLVGYDDANQYFIAKNSWGTGWGEAGYFRIAFSELASVVGFGAGTLAYYTSTALPSITLASPVGGESLTAGGTATIKWGYSGNPGSTVEINLLKGGVQNRVISSSTSIGSGGMGSFSWTIPADVAAGSDYQVSVVSITDPTVFSTSGANFTISPVPPAPAAPTGLTATINTYITGRGKKKITNTGVAVSFQASSSSVGIAGYSIFRNGSLLTKTSATSYQDTTTVAGGGTYTYTVQAYDTLGQTSPMSSPASVTR